MSQQFCSPEEDKEEKDIQPDQNWIGPRTIEYSNCDVSFLSSPEAAEIWSGTISVLSSPATQLRDQDIICSNGMSDHDQDNHPGNVKMKEIIQGFVQEWNDTKPEQRTPTLKDDFLEQIKSEIEDQQGSPSFLIRNAEDTQWVPASDQVIHEEILVEWRHQISMYGRDKVEMNKQALSNTRRLSGAFPRYWILIFVVAMVATIVGIILATTRRREPTKSAPNPFSSATPADVASVTPTAIPTVTPTVPPVINFTETPSMTPSRTASATPTVTPDAESATLSTILRREYLKCGVMSQQGFAQQDPQGIWDGFEVDLCRVVAAGIFGKDSFGDGQKEPVEFVSLEAGERFPSLNNNSIDLLLAKTSHTFERSLYEVSPT